MTEKRERAERSLSSSSKPSSLAEKHKSGVRFSQEVRFSDRVHVYSEGSGAARRIVERDADVRDDSTPHDNSKKRRRGDRDLEEGAHLHLEAGNGENEEEDSVNGWGDDEGGGGAAFDDSGSCRSAPSPLDSTFEPPGTQPSHHGAGAAPAPADHGAVASGSSPAVIQSRSRIRLLTPTSVELDAGSFSDSYSRSVGMGGGGSVLSSGRQSAAGALTPRFSVTATGGTSGVWQWDEAESSRSGAGEQQQQHATARSTTRSCSVSKEDIGAHASSRNKGGAGSARGSPGSERGRARTASEGGSRRGSIDDEFDRWSFRSDLDLLATASDDQSVGDGAVSDVFLGDDPDGGGRKLHRGTGFGPFLGGEQRVAVISSSSAAAAQLRPRKTSASSDCSSFSAVSSVSSSAIASAAAAPLAAEGEATTTTSSTQLSGSLSLSCAAATAASSSCPPIDYTCTDDSKHALPPSPSAVASSAPLQLTPGSSSLQRTSGKKKGSRLPSTAEHVHTRAGAVASRPAALPDLVSHSGLRLVVNVSQMEQDAESLADVIRTLRAQKAQLEAHLHWLSTAHEAVTHDVAAFTAAVMRTQCVTHLAHALVVPASDADAAVVNDLFDCPQTTIQLSLPQSVNALPFAVGEVGQLTSSAPLLRRLCACVERGGSRGGGESATGTSSSCTEAAEASSSSSDRPPSHHLLSSPFLALPFAVALCPLPSVDTDAYAAALEALNHIHKL